MKKLRLWKLDGLKKRHRTKVNLLIFLKWLQAQNRFKKKSRPLIILGEALPYGG